MKKIIIGLLALTSVSAFAEPQITCYLSSEIPQTVEGAYMSQSLPAGAQLLLATKSFPIISLAPPLKIELQSGKISATAIFYSVNKGTTDGTKTLKHGFTTLEMSVRTENSTSPITTQKSIYASKVGFSETLTYQGISLNCTNVKSNKVFATPSAPSMGIPFGSPSHAPFY